MHSDTGTRCWGPSACPSSAATTSCGSMTMHGPMSQGYVHNSWKTKKSQFFDGLHTHQTLNMFGILWIAVCDSVFQFLTKYPATSHSYWRVGGQHSTGHNQQPDQLYVKEMCPTAWGKWWSHQILTVFLIHAPTSFFKVSVTNRCIFVLPVMWNP